MGTGEEICERTLSQTQVTYQTSIDRFKAMIESTEEPPEEPAEVRSEMNQTPRTTSSSANHPTKKLDLKVASLRGSAALCLTF